MAKSTTAEASETKKFTSTEVDEAKKFGEFIIDLLDQHKESFSFYLADTAVLDWFGRTIRGPKDINAHLTANSRSFFRHHFSVAQPVQNIGFRESHVIKSISAPLQIDRNILEAVGRNETTPPKRALPGVNKHVPMTEIGQGDGLHNDEVLESPKKKLKLDYNQGDTSTSQVQVKYFSADGHIEFRKKSSKKLQSETKWNRPCRLQVAYCGDSFDNCTIYMMIYQGNMKCRRNLLKDFESCEQDD